MSSLGLPVPPGFTITTEVCTHYYANGRQLSRRTSKAQVDAGARRRSSEPSARKFGDAGEPAAGLGALRRARLDAGHDGHGPQPRPQRRDGRGPGRAQPATRASPTTATAASSRCTATSCWASTTTISRRCSRSTRRTAASRSTPSSTADDWKKLVAGLQGQGRRRSWASRSRRTRRSSSGARSARCSAAG